MSGCLLVSAPAGAAVPDAGPPVGIFDGQQDVGDCARAGGAAYDPATASYTITGGGANLWGTNDAFHFVWKKMSGDVALTARVDFTAASPMAHRKACLLIRQDLTPDAAYVDAALHGDGLTALQYRETSGANTCELRAEVVAPNYLRLEKQGDYFCLETSPDGSNWQPACGSFRLHLAEPFYVGLGVCSHDNQTTEQAVFSAVQLTVPAATVARTQLFSILETVDVLSHARQTLYVTTNHIEAPNWARDGSLIFNAGGQLFRLGPGAALPQLIATGDAGYCNNDHGLSPDGSQLAFSASPLNQPSRVYILPLGDGPPTLITTNGPSYWHGWAPDGRTLVFCGSRNGEYDVYAIPAAGGGETRLTTAPGLDDGPEYSPDGRYIYFNSERTGTMQIWRMRPDGTEQEPVTHDQYNNWFAHLSPDGRQMVFLSFEPEVKGHPANQNVSLRLMPVAGGPPETLTTLFGGQGTINVPSWSPDSAKVAFVSYQFR